MCYFSRGYYGEHSREIILNIDQRFSRCLSKSFFFPFLALGSFYLTQRGNLCTFGRWHNGKQANFLGEIIAFKFEPGVSGLQIKVRTENIFSYFSAKTYVVGTQKNRLNETVLWSTQNTC